MYSRLHKVTEYEGIILRRVHKLNLLRRAVHNVGGCRSYLLNEIRPRLKVVERDLTVSAGGVLA